MKSKPVWCRQGGVKFRCPPHFLASEGLGHGASGRAADLAHMLATGKGAMLDRRQ
jgi:hypothetical protein